MWTKVRPGARAFLARAAERFELWIHTAGTSTYAAAMAGVLGAEYFGGRVIAQAEGPGGPRAVDKRLAAGLEGREPVAVILDDSGAAWPHDRRGLMVAGRYVFLPTARAPAASLMEAGRDECPRTGMLAAAAGALERVHAAVFARLRGGAPQDLWDARAVLGDQRRRVLAGARVAFSRVVPLDAADARAHPLWRLAELYGAEVSEAPSGATTHVVAAQDGTDKVLWARERGKHVVSPAWIECSCVLWRKADEARFPPPPPPPAPARGGAAG